MISQIFAIARHAFVESRRQQIFAVLLLLVSGLLLLNPALSNFTIGFGENQKFLVDLGLSTLLLGALFLASFTTTAVFRREIEDGTLLTVLTKPVSQMSFLLGKFLGIAAATTLALWIWSLIFLLTLRHGVAETAREPFDVPVLLLGFGAAFLALGTATGANYFASKSFGATLSSALAFLLTLAYVGVLLLDAEWGTQPITTDLDPQVLIALLLVIEMAWLFAAIALCAATRLGQVSTLVACVLLLLAGLSSDYALDQLAPSSYVARAVEVAIPNFQFLWLADALTQERTVSLTYLGLTTAYTLLFIQGAVLLATALLRGEAALHQR